jgi:phage shock protein PspC (stress-responsive transcriptional regulator)
MKKTISINLNGMLFNIDDDAYKRLEEYLKRLEAHFSGRTESGEIMNDIEARIAELLNERLGGAKKAVSLADVDEIIRTMGNPDDFEEAGEEDHNKKQYYYSHRPRRLYRDPDNRVLGGVCGGMGAYLNVDTVIIRIIFVIIFFGFGAGLLIYLILWIVIPEANTTAQKLEMRGDPVNASNIGNFIKEEFENVKSSFSSKKRRS